MSSLFFGFFTLDTFHMFSGSFIPSYYQEEQSWNIIFVWALSFDQLKGGCGIIGKTRHEVDKVIFCFCCGPFQVEYILHMLMQKCSRDSMQLQISRISAIPFFCVFSSFPVSNIFDGYNKKWTYWNYFKQKLAKKQPWAEIHQALLSKINLLSKLFLCISRF